MRRCRREYLAAVSVKRRAAYADGLSPRIRSFPFALTISKYVAEGVGIAGLRRGRRSRAC